MMFRLIFAFVKPLIITTFRKEDDVAVPFIAQKIMQARDISLEKGQAKYRTYFVKTSLYQRYKEEVDTILGTTEQTNGDTYEDCIVAQ